MKNTILKMITVYLVLVFISGCSSVSSDISDRHFQANILFVKDVNTYYEVVEVLGTDNQFELSGKEADKLNEVLAEYGVKEVFSTMDDVPVTELSGEYTYQRSYARKVTIPEEQIDNILKALENYTVQVNCTDEEKKTVKVKAEVIIR